MQKPATWRNDPPCGHEVAAAHQTHYCTYIRVPKLLSLQQPLTPHPSELIYIVAHQTFELWFKVIHTDLRAAVQRLGDEDLEAVKLLQRDAELAHLLITQADMTESLLLSDPDIGLSLRPTAERARPELAAAIGRALRRLQADRERRAPAPALAHALNDFAARWAHLRPRFNRLLNLAPQADRLHRPDYLRLPELLDLQDGPKADWTPEDQAPTRLAPSEPLDPDETMFIIVHQAFELWFKAMLAHVDEARAALLGRPPGVRRASQLMRRVVAMQRFLAQQIHIPTTMLPMDFLQFREQVRVVDGVTYRRGLSPASGTESYQFRELEIASGLRCDTDFHAFLEGAPRLYFRPLTPRHAERLAQPTLAEAFAAALAARGVRRVDDIFAPADAPNPHADLQQLADWLLEYDEYFMLWRVRHLNMVERMIGGKSGTGFLGPEYLKETVGVHTQGGDRLIARPQRRPRFFEDLWQARTRFKIVY